MANSDQERMWDTTAADAWIRHVDDFDATLNPWGRAVMDALALRPDERVLDIGCGVGTTSMELASRVPSGSVLGVDISSRMAKEAERRATSRGITNLAFRVTDAQTADFGDTFFDVAFSRVGVMFFGDPVAAFTNIRAALANDARLGFVCFQSPMNNPFLTVPILCAIEHLGLVPPQLDGPGPFSLSDAEHLREILSAAGFANIRIEAGPNQAEIPAVGDLNSVARRLLEQNPFTAAKLAELSDDNIASVSQAVAEAIEPYRAGDQLTMAAGTWVVLAGPA